MNGVLSAMFVVVILGMMGFSLVVDLLRYTPRPDSEITLPGKTSPSLAPPTEGSGFNPGSFRGPTGSPRINGPSAPPPY
jgi:hypothetical protein